MRGAQGLDHPVQLIAIAYAMDILYSKIQPVFFFETRNHAEETCPWHGIHAVSFHPVYLSAGTSAIDTILPARK